MVEAVVAVAAEVVDGVSTRAIAWIIFRDLHQVRLAGCRIRNGAGRFEASALHDKSRAAELGPATPPRTCRSSPGTAVSSRKMRVQKRGYEALGRSFVDVVEAVAVKKKDVNCDGWMYGTTSGMDCAQIIRTYIPAWPRDDNVQHACGNI